MPSHTTSLQSIVLILFCAGAMGAVFSAFRLPAIIAFIATGILLGPGGLHWLDNTEMVTTMAEVGIIFLMFILGLELSMPKLKTMRSHTIWIGLAQLLFTIGIMAFIAKLLGFPSHLSLFLAGTIALSSTAVVLNQLNRMHQIDAVHGRIAMGLLVIQDLSLIPLMAFMPLLIQANTTNSSMGSLLLMITGKALLFFALVALCAWQVPKLFDRLAYRMPKDVFAVAVFSFSLLMAFIANCLGLSFAVGAFVAGLTLNSGITSRYIALQSVPFRDIFSTVFFVSVGLLMNVPFFMSHWPLIIAITLGISATKALIIVGLLKLFRFPLLNSLWCGLSLFQLSEFAFVLMQNAMAHQALDTFTFNMMISVIVLSMLLTPLVMNTMPSIAQWLRAHQPTPKLDHPDSRDTDSASIPTSPHTADIILAGYGPVARQLLHVLNQYQMHACVVEMNAKTVATLNANGTKALFGDISHEAMLLAAGVREAKLLAITIPDVHSALVTVQLAKRLNPTIYCLVRCRFQEHTEELRAVGADWIINEEWETGLGFIQGTLGHLLGFDESQQQLSRWLSHADLALDSSMDPQDSQSFGRLNVLGETKIEWVGIPEESALVGQTLGELNLRQQTGVSIVSVLSSNGDQQANPSADYCISANDMLIAIGTLPQLHELERIVNH